MRTYEYEQKLIFLAFRSDSQTLVDTQKLVAPERFRVNSTIFAHDPLVTMMKNTILKPKCDRWLKYTTCVK